jgi:hypothetical protein
MREKTKRWLKTCNRFVAFMDIMGFKEMVAREPHQEVLERMKWFRENVIDAIEQEAQRRLVSGGRSTEKSLKLFGGSIVRPVMFSDSILLVSNDDSIESADYLLFCVRRLLRESLKKGIPIKGAIAHGKQTADFEKSLHLGQPLIDAYELQNEMLLYGVILHHSFDRYIDDLDMVDQFEQYSNIYKYLTPLKNGTVNHHIVGWLTAQHNNDISLADISRLYNSVSGSSRRYVDNTIDFARWLNGKLEP